MEKMGQNLKNRELGATILRRESYWPHIKNTENELKNRDYRSLWLLVRQISHKLTNHEVNKSSDEHSANYNKMYILP